MKLHTALTIAGTDPSGGAGIMADLKSFQSRNVYGMAVVTSVVAQNTTGVHHVEHLSLESVKTGMIALPEMMDLIYPYVSKDISYVMDPVMIATSGDRLVSDEAVNFLKSKLIPTATVITPNRSEAEVLADMSITCESDITTAANRILQDLGPQVVIIKGGHIGEDATDYAFTKDGSVRTWTSPKYDTVHTHGAIGIAKDYIALAIKYNPALGNGCGPVNHMAYGLLANGTETMDELLKKDERR
ncbi:MAG: bifunctional hydroxymethylpyrimidine kinase/phosphomethylpyrimidine kinase [Veillonella sp.]|nr:bifunctional hydroxymethylpyrimidine kinase/phosphomethylpyrimidine kinase [Veillonella sp.]